MLYKVCNIIISMYDSLTTLREGYRNITDERSKPPDPTLHLNLYSQRYLKLDQAQD